MGFKQLYIIGLVVFVFLVILFIGLRTNIVNEAFVLGGKFHPSPFVPDVDNDKELLEIQKREDLIKQNAILESSKRDAAFLKNIERERKEKQDREDYNKKYSIYKTNLAKYETCVKKENAEQKYKQEMEEYDKKNAIYEKCKKDEKEAEEKRIAEQKQIDDAVAEQKRIADAAAEQKRIADAAAAAAAITTTPVVTTPAISTLDMTNRHDLCPNDYGFPTGCGPGCVNMQFRDYKWRCTNPGRAWQTPRCPPGYTLNDQQACVGSGPTGVVQPIKCKILNRPDNNSSEIYDWMEERQNGCVV